MGGCIASYQMFLPAVEAFNGTHWGSEAQLPATCPDHTAGRLDPDCTDYGTCVCVCVRVRVRARVRMCVLQYMMAILTDTVHASGTYGKGVTSHAVAFKDRIYVIGHDRYGGMYR